MKSPSSVLLFPGWTRYLNRELYVRVQVDFVSSDGLREARFVGEIGEESGKSWLRGQFVRPPPIVRYNKGWSPGLVHRLWELWRRWHLCASRLTCPHQRLSQKMPLPENLLAMTGTVRGRAYALATNIIAPLENIDEGQKCPECGHRCGDPYREGLPPEVEAELLRFPREKGGVR